MRATLPWITAAMLLVTANSPHAQEKDVEHARAVRIDERLQKDYDAWSRKPEDSRTSYSRMIDTLLDPLSPDEIRILADYGSDLDIDEELYRRWARFDPEAALKAARKAEDRYTPEMKDRRNGLDGNSGEGIADSVAALYLAAMRGWAEVAPKAAWQALGKREGSLAGSDIIDDYLSGFYPILMKPLAKVDPDLAFNEILASGLKEKDDFLRASMLEGYFRGASRGRDWRRELDRLLETPPRHHRMQTQIRVALMARWLEDAPGAAEEWFRSGDIEGVHWELVPLPGVNIDPFESAAVNADKKERRKYDLSGAAGYWAARDFSAAWRWMKSHEDLGREGIGISFMRGLSENLAEKPWKGQPEERQHCLKELAKLPERADREQFALLFARELWMFDDTPGLDMPAPDRTEWLEKIRKNLDKLGLGPEAVAAIIGKLGG